jgi:hypothetical protein
MSVEVKLKALGAMEADVLFVATDYEIRTIGSVYSKKGQSESTHSSRSSNSQAEEGEEAEEGEKQ